MIPKIIHYCWFGPKKLSAMEKRCLASWQKYCPDYEIRKWTEKDFDFSTNPYAREALAHGAWAHLSDYARNVILAEHGGIYFDTDVELCRSLDSLLEQDGFCGVEDEKINSGLGLAAIPHHPVIEALINLYDDVSFILPDGKINTATNTELQHQVFTRFGFASQKSGTIQHFSGMTAYPPEYFCPKSYRDGSLHLTENTYSIHHYHASWASPASRIGYHLRRLAGEKVYTLVRNLFHAPEKLVTFWCFLLVFCQNLRGVLNASSLNIGITGKILTLLIIILAGSIFGIQILRRKISWQWGASLTIGAVILAASPWNSMLLWMFLLGGVSACFSFRTFAKCNVISLAIILSGWLTAVFCGIIPSTKLDVIKIVWIKVYDFGFDNPNLFSLFLFQLTVYLYYFISKQKWLVLSLIPIAAAGFWGCGGRCYTLGILLIAVLHFVPKIVKRKAVRGIGWIVILLLLTSVILGYRNPSWNILTLLNNRIPYWHSNLMRDTSLKSILLGRILDKKPPVTDFVSNSGTKHVYWNMKLCGSRYPEISSISNDHWVLKHGDLSGANNPKAFISFAAIRGLLYYCDDPRDNWVALRKDISPRWQLVGSGDFTGSGKDCALLFDPDKYQYYTVDYSGNMELLTTTDPDWQICAIGDFRLDGKDDIIVGFHRYNLLARLEDGKWENWVKLGQLDLKNWTVEGIGKLADDPVPALIVRHNARGAIGAHPGGDLSKWVLLANKRLRQSSHLPMDSSYLKLYINTGIVGVCTFLWLMFAALKNHQRMVYRLLPVWCALIFAGFFESHVLGSSMLGLLPFYFFFRRKGRV